jgi:hypothetical protein
MFVIQLPNLRYVRKQAPPGREPTVARLYDPAIKVWRSKQGAARWLLEHAHINGEIRERP